MVRLPGVWRGTDKINLLFAFCEAQNLSFMLESDGTCWVRSNVPRRKIVLETYWRQRGERPPAEIVEPAPRVRPGNGL